MLDLPLGGDGGGGGDGADGGDDRNGRARTHLSDLSDLIDADLAGRPIRVAGHCYGCSAGQGSSCGGALA